jgi:fibronectin type 3 domain-containing protein
VATALRWSRAWSLAGTARTWSGQVDLSWSAVADATGYRVERSTDGATWTSVAETPGGVTSHSDTGLAAETTYHYGSWRPTPVATRRRRRWRPPPRRRLGTSPRPACRRAHRGLGEAEGQPLLVLSWSASTDAGGSGLAGYTVWRGTAGASGSFTAIATSSGTSYSDTTVTSKVTYWYRVTAFDSAGNQSQPSNVVTARPK